MVYDEKGCEGVGVVVVLGYGGFIGIEFYFGWFSVLYVCESWGWRVRWEVVLD